MTNDGTLTQVVAALSSMFEETLTPFDAAFTAPETTPEVVDGAYPMMLFWPAPQGGTWEQIDYPDTWCETHYIDCVLLLAPRAETSGVDVIEVEMRKWPRRVKEALTTHRQLGNVVYRSNMLSYKPFVAVLNDGPHMAMQFLVETQSLVDIMPGVG